MKQKTRPTRDELFAFRLTYAERVQLEAFADEYGMTPSKFARLAVAQKINRLQEGA